MLTHHCTVAYNFITLPLILLHPLLQLFEILEHRAQHLGVAHYGISMPTLEEVFLRASGGAGGAGGSSSGSACGAISAAGGSGRWQAGGGGGGGDSSPVRPGSEVNVFLRCSTGSSRLSTYTGGRAGLGWAGLPAQQLLSDQSCLSEPWLAYVCGARRAWCSPGVGQLRCWLLACKVQPCQHLPHHQHLPHRH